MTRPNGTVGGTQSDMARNIRSRIIQVLGTLAVQGALLLGSGGDLGWLWGWGYIGLSLTMLLGNALVLLRTSRELVAERARVGGGKRWDRWVSGLWALASFVGVLVVAGLDHRFAWSPPLALGWRLLGAVAYVVGDALTVWAMRVNAFFATAVRIQTERGHAVCDRGPYAWIRHPGYLGFIGYGLLLPLMLGSLWSLIPAGVAGALIALRTALEDRTLQAELPGYAEYAQRVRYRLLPGVW
ncbi:MAG: isoprenylcysteine carboxylmethyltransferase family protein [Chloroflexota bacterium]